MYDELATNFNHLVGTCTHCNEVFTRDPRHDYMLTKEIWQQVHPEGRKGFLHVPAVSS